MTRSGIFGLFAVAFAVSFAAEDRRAAGADAPWVTCREAAHRDWLPSEVWAWTTLCSGRPADFSNRRHSYELAPDRRAGWDEARRLRSNFIRALLSDPGLKPFMPRSGVRIMNAYFTEDIVLSDLEIERVLSISESRFEGNVLINRARVSTLLSIFGSTVAKDLIINQTDARLVQVDGSSIRSLAIVESNFEGSVMLERSEIRDCMYLDRAIIKGSIFARKAKLVSAGPRDCEDWPYAIRYSLIERNVDFSGSELGKLKLESTKIGGELRLANKDYGNAVWHGTSGLLSLQASRIGQLRDSALSWPPRLELNGFEFERWTGSAEKDGLGHRSDLWFRTWIDKEPHFLPEVYIAVAGALQRLGETSKAHSVMFEKKAREHAGATGYEWFLLWAHWGAVGYGYKLEYGFVWFMILVLVAFLVFDSGAQHAHGPKPRSWFFFAFDTIIPVINLDKRHEDISFTGWRQYFLYFMKFMSAVLVFFVFKYLEQTIDGK